MRRDEIKRDIRENGDVSHECYVRKVMSKLRFCQPRQEFKEMKEQLSTRCNDTTK